MKKILVVEDLSDNADLVCKILISAGYEVIHAADAETGLEMALDQCPDLILLDLGLPDYDGQTLAGWLRYRPETAQIPIVALTAWPEETAWQMAESYSCSGYIAKPIVKVNDFITKIASFLEKD